MGIRHRKKGLVTCKDCGKQKLCGEGLYGDERRIKTESNRLLVALHRDFRNDVVCFPARLIALRAVRSLRIIVLRHGILGFYPERSSFAGCTAVCLLVSRPACGSLSPAAKRLLAARFPPVPNPGRRQCLLHLLFFSSRLLWSGVTSLLPRQGMPLILPVNLIQVMPVGIPDRRRNLVNFQIRVLVQLTRLMHPQTR